MANRDGDFSPATKRILRDRAGNRCSICAEPTSGPADEETKALINGDAAHVTGARPGGPRYDESLSVDQRRSIENGIWACTQHAREIDRDGSTFTVENLRNLKFRREEASRDELQHATRGSDVTASLVELPHVTSQNELFEILIPQRYVYSVTSSIRDLAKLADDRERLMRMVSELGLEVWNTHPDVAGLMFTLMSQLWTYWNPSKAIVAKLSKICTSTLEDGVWTTVSLIEPLAFTLGAIGNTEIHRRYIEQALRDSRWRRADAKRIYTYYGSYGVELAGIRRHRHLPRRPGLLRINDVTREITLLASSDDQLRQPKVREELLGFVDRDIRILLKAGEKELAQEALTSGIGAFLTPEVGFRSN